MKTIALFALATLAHAQARLPEFTREVLPNGAVLLLMPRASTPLVHFRVLVKGGTESDPAPLAGLANATANLLRRGTSRRTAAKFAEELDSLGGTFNVNVGGAATAVSAEFLSKDFDAGLDLLADAVLHPAFEESEARKELSRTIDGIRASKDNPQAAIQLYFRAAFYGPQHPYGSPPDEASIGRIGRKEIAEYHQKTYVGRNLIVIASGDFQSAAAKAKLTKLLGAAAPGNAFAYSAPAPPERKPKLLLIDKPDATQTYFEIAQPRIDRKNPDRVALQLVNTLFGGRFTSILNDELRVNSGLTYGASSRLDQNRLPGAISISTYTRTETTVQAMDKALDLLTQFNEKGIAEEQLASAKAYVKGVYPTRALETIDQLAEVLGDLEIYGQSRAEIDGYFARIDAVTLAQANEVIRKYYKRDGLSFVVLGAGAKIRDALKKYVPTVAEIRAGGAGWR